MQHSTAKLRIFDKATGEVIVSDSFRDAFLYEVVAMYAGNDSVDDILSNESEYVTSHYVQSGYRSYFVSTIQYEHTRYSIRITERIQ